MCRVFVVEHPKPNLDINSAEEFGELTFIFEPNDRRCSAFHHVSFGRAILDKLESLNYNPNEDYICIVGSILVVSIAMITIAQAYPSFKALLFNSIDSCYVEKQFTKGERHEIID